MDAGLTESPHVVQTGRMGRKPLIGKRETRLTFSAEDIAYLDAVTGYLGASSWTGAIRHVLREFARDKKIKIVPPVVVADESASE